MPQVNADWIAAIRARIPDLDLRPADTIAQAEERAADVECLVTFGRKLPDGLLPRATRLQWIHSLSVGVDGLLDSDGLTTDIVVTNCRGAHSDDVADHAFAFILAHARCLPAFGAAQRDHRWQKRGLDDQMFHLEGRVLGIVGLGSIGEAIARRGSAFGMRVWATRRRGGAVAGIERLLPTAGLDELLEAADVVVVACALTADTQGLFNAPRFERMKRTAFFVNVARGSIVRETDLVAALQNGRIAGAGLDVFEEEPLPETSPLWTLPNVILTPHMSVVSPGSIERASAVWAENVRRYRAREPLLTLVDRTLGY
jgi:phosphoglycerate dehydrogenase-like enzyme